MHPQLRERLVAIEYSDLAQLTSQASRVEQCIVEKEQSWSGHVRPRGPQLISIIECDSIEEDTWEELKRQANIMTPEFVHGKPYTCPALPPSKVKEIAKLEKESYLFNISKVDQIFDCFVKDKQIKLPEGHKILPADEVKAKNYCEWHHSWSHMTNNCTAFRNTIQKALKKGRLKLSEKGDMTVDTNPFGFSMNMVSVFISLKEQKEGKVPKWKRKLKEKDEAWPSCKTVWKPKPIKTQEIGGQSVDQRVCVFQRLQYLGQFQGRIGYHNQDMKESNHPKLA